MRFSPIAFASTAALFFCAAPLMSVAQDAPVEHPAFGPRHISQLSLEIEVADIAKLEAKAVDILRTKYGKTLDEARAMVRVDWKTDVARCI